MKSVLVLVAAALLAAVPVVANDGVLVEDRVVNLPQDQAKWHVSIVGQPCEKSFEWLVKQFESGEKLATVRKQVHYHVVKAGTPIYTERYAPNIAGLPTVRVQQGDGVVVYEAAGDAIPYSDEALYAAIADSAKIAQGIRPILPWRREMERRCQPDRPCPNPNPDPIPEPDPIPDENVGPPDFATPKEEDTPVAAVVGLTILSFLAGGVGGFVSQWKKTYAGLDR